MASVKTVLVTGASGVVGSGIVRAWLSSGAHVIAPVRHVYTKVWIDFLSNKKYQMLLVSPRSLLELCIDTSSDVCMQERSFENPPYYVPA